MSEHDTTEDPTDLDQLAELVLVDNLTTVEGAVELIDAAIMRGLSATKPIAVGDHGLAFRKPNGDVQIVDVREHEDEPRLPSFITAREKFVSVESLARYLERFEDPDQTTTVANIADPYGKGLSMLTSDTDVAWVTLDDHPLNVLVQGGYEPPVGRRSHTATLVLRPTEPAKRWGAALHAPHLSQERFLDLIVDGITEIAEPDGAVLRDLVQDLHAIRTSEVQSVVRTGGEGSIELKENVKLAAGTGNRVTFPEQMTVTFAPFVGVSEVVILKVRIKPTVGDTKVNFALSCAHLDDSIAKVMGGLAANIFESTGLNPLWRP